MNERDNHDGVPAGKLVTVADVKADAEVAAYIAEADRVLAVLGYTEHGDRHAAEVSARARALLAALGYKERRCELAAIAGYLHDIGNVVNRQYHEIVSATLSRHILDRLGMDPLETVQVLAAIGNHDEGSGEPVSAIGAAVILGDKSDARRNRVRNPSMISFDIHDRVNYAAVDSGLEVDAGEKAITLKLTIDTDISQVMEYFETFLARMTMCRRAAHHLGCSFSLYINETRML